MRELFQHTALHHGVISRDEALELGLSTGQIAHRLRTGQLVRTAPSVYAVAGAPVTWLTNARSAALALNGVVSHRSAANMHGIDGYTPSHQLEITVPKSRRPRSVDVLVHRSTQFHLIDTNVINAIPVTGIARTVLDIAGVVSFRRLEWTVDAVIRQQLCGWDDLMSVLICHSVQGRNGCGPLRALLDQRCPEDVVPDSKWNRMVGQLLVSAGLPTPEFEHVVVDRRGNFAGRVDLAFPRVRVAIELDSVRWHLNRRSFEADPRRKNQLTNAGWTVLTFTWSDYADNPAGLIRTVRDAIAAA